MVDDDLEIARNMADAVFKVDLHTHSSASPDGGIAAAEYWRALDDGILNVVAITDHDRIDFAQAMAKERPAQIIVGQEISTVDGELIGLFLQTAIPPGLSALKTAQSIKEQSGIVIAPHPLEKIRKGVSLETLQSLVNYLDAVEVINGRAWRETPLHLQSWLEETGIPGLASSDSHSHHDLGKTYTALSTLPDAYNFRRCLESKTLYYKSPSLRGRLAPSLNRLRKRTSST